MYSMQPALRPRTAAALVLVASLLRAAHRLHQLPAPAAPRAVHMHMPGEVRDEAAHLLQARVSMLERRMQAVAERAAVRLVEAAGTCYVAS